MASSTFANRDEPIPVLRVPTDDLAVDLSNSDETATHVKRISLRNRAREFRKSFDGSNAALKVQADRLRANINNARDDLSENRDALRDQRDRLVGSFESVKDELRSGSMQERLMTSLLGRIIPPEEIGPDGAPVIDKRSRAYVDRPSFSLPLMSSNFRRFNSRIGIVFVFQNRLIYLFTWRAPTQTMAFLAIFTLVCLQPALIPAVPLALIFFFVMIPSFLARHPPPPQPSEGELQNHAELSNLAEAESVWSTYAYTLHPTAPPPRVRPAPEMSKDFFRNMRDLQNCMEDFSVIHDAAVNAISPYTDFSDEKTSSATFLAIFILLFLATISSHLVPWRFIGVLGGWGATAAGHPKVQDLIHDLLEHESVKDAASFVRTYIANWINTDIALDLPPEVREVEVFELQRKVNRTSTVTSCSNNNSSNSGRHGSDAPGESDIDDENWEHWLFTTSPHDPLCPQRLSGAWPVGTQFFEEVSAPIGWFWRDKKWTLDLLSEAWVEERCITGVEVEREGSRWVYDIAYPEIDHTVRNTLKAKSLRSWEEGTNRAWKGEWRRRRWVRLVERQAQKRDGAVHVTPLATMDAGIANPGPIDAAAIVS